MKEEKDDLFLIVGGLGLVFVIGVGGYFFLTNQKKLSFEEWVKKSSTSLSYFEVDKSKGWGFGGDDGRRYNIDKTERLCIEEIRKHGILKPNESVRRFPNCRVGTIDYLVSEYKKYNPGGSIPYGMTGELTISEGGKQTKGSTPINTPSVTHVTNHNKNTTPVPNSVTIKLRDGTTFTSLRENTFCKLEKFKLHEKVSTNHHEYNVNDDNRSKVIGPGFSINCESPGVIEDLTGLRKHESGLSWRCYRHDQTILNREQVTVEIPTESGSGFHISYKYTNNWETKRGGKGYTKPNNSNWKIVCSMGKKFGLIKPLIKQGNSYVNSYRLDETTMTYVVNN